MVMWKHQRLPRVTHFWHFWVNLWTNEKVPRGSPYTTWQTVHDSDVADDVDDDDMLGAWHDVYSG
jgi:hypothetical protein